MQARKVSDVENKLLLLLAVEQLGPATSLQLLQFFVENDLMDYITLQLALGELLQGGQLSNKPHVLGTLYALTGAGRDTLSLFANRLPYSLAQRIRTPAAGWRIRFQREKQMPASFSRREDGLFALHLQLMEKDLPLMDLTAALQTWEEADLFSRRWPDRAEAVYGYLMQSLGGDFSQDALPAQLPDHACLINPNKGDCRLTLTEGPQSAPLLSLTLSLPTEPMAWFFAGRWPDKAQTFRKFLLEELSEGGAAPLPPA